MSNLTDEQLAKCREEYREWLLNGNQFCCEPKDLFAAGYQAAWSAAQPKWLPIESAPRDGTVILAYCPTTMDYMRIVPLRWVYVDHLTCNGWLDGNESSWGGITHWMPLPTPPTQPSGGEGGE